MTVTVAPQPAVKSGSEGPARLVPVSVNLLPDEILGARSARTARRMTLAALVVVALAVGAWYYQGRSSKSDAASQLAAAQALAQAQLNDQGNYADLDRTKADIATLQTQLATVTAGDVLWSKVIAGIRSVSPQGILFTGFTATANSATQVPVVPATPTASGTSSTGTSEAPPIDPNLPMGALVITGSSPNKPLISQLVIRLPHVPGLSDALLTNVAAATDDTKNLTFSIQVTTTARALNLRYTNGAR